jgi:putative flippase GtrA
MIQSDPIRATHADTAILRIRRLLPEIFRFIGSGLIVFPLGLGLSAYCHEVLGWREELASAAGIAVLLLVNFATGRIFVFRSAGKVRHEFMRFVSIALLMRGAEYLMFFAIFRLLHMPYLLSMLAALVISSLTKFWLYRTWVFDSRVREKLGRGEGN